MGTDVAEAIVSNLGGRKQGDDRLIWLVTSDGSFPTKSVWSFVRVTAPKSQWSHWIWHGILPKKFSILMWKALNNNLSVDDQIRRIGVPLVSKCKCCHEGAFEDLNHVLYGGNIAVAIWKFSSHLLGIPYVASRSWKATVEAWFR